MRTYTRDAKRGRTAVKCNTCCSGPEEAPGKEIIDRDQSDAPRLLFPIEDLYSVCKGLALFSSRATFSRLHPTVHARHASRVSRVRDSIRETRRWRWLPVFPGWPLPAPATSWTRGQNWCGICVSVGIIWEDALAGFILCMLSSMRLIRCNYGVIENMRMYNCLMV